MFDITKLPELGSNLIQLAAGLMTLCLAFGVFAFTALLIWDGYRQMTKAWRQERELQNLIKEETR